MPERCRHLLLLGCLLSTTGSCLPHQYLAPVAVPYPDQRPGYVLTVGPTSLFATVTTGFMQALGAPSNETDVSAADPLDQFAIGLRFGSRDGARDSSWIGLGGQLARTTAGNLGWLMQAGLGERPGGPLALFSVAWVTLDQTMGERINFWVAGGFTAALCSGDQGWKKPLIGGGIGASGGVQVRTWGPV